MGAKIHATAIVDPKAEIGEDVEIGPYCMIAADAKIGARTRLQSHVVIESHVTIGEDNEIHPFVVLGGPAQDTSYKGEPTRLEIGSRNIIREHASMHRGTVRGSSVTRVGSDGFFMAQTHIGHDCQVGDHVILAQGSCIGGHVRLAEHVILGGLAAVHQYARIGRHAFVGGLSAVVADVIPYGSAFGVHAHLTGLNVIGLKRRNFSREAIHDLRAAYRLLFAEEGTFQERLEDAIEVYAQRPEVMEIIDFIRAEANRPLCMPRD